MVKIGSKNQKNDEQFKDQKQREGKNKKKCFVMTAKELDKTQQSV